MPIWLFILLDLLIFRSSIVVWWNKVVISKKMVGTALIKELRNWRFLQSTVSSLYKSLLDLNRDASSSGAIKLFSIIWVSRYLYLIKINLLSLNQTWFGEREHDFWIEKYWKIVTKNFRFIDKTKWKQRKIIVLLSTSMSKKHYCFHYYFSISLWSTWILR